MKFHGVLKLQFIQHVRLWGFGGPWGTWLRCYLMLLRGTGRHCAALHSEGPHQCLVYHRMEPRGLHTCYTADAFAQGHRSHLLCHCADGFFVPVDFGDVPPIFDAQQRVPGGWLGSSVQLMSELLALSAILDIA